MKRHRLETEHGKVFAVTSGAITRVNWGLDHLAILMHETGMRNLFTFWDMAHVKVRVLRNDLQPSWTQEKRLDSIIHVQVTLSG